MERIIAMAHHLGGSLDPHACFLLERGLKTLSLRVARQTDNALKLALFLADHPAIARVRYPGLPGDPNHGRAKRYYEHFGAMVTVETRTEAAADALLQRLRYPKHAASLGGVESLVVLTPGNEIRVEDLPPELRSLAPAADRPPAPRTLTASAEALKPGSTAGLTMDEIERRAIEDALERTGGNRTQAAEMLGIGLRTLQRKLKEYRAIVENKLQELERS